jgi:3-oxoacyl-[acyl-carrier protein] reductase
VYQADVSDRAQTEALIGAVVERAGRLDVLVNNAGISREGLFVETPDDEWASVLETNLDAVFAARVWAPGTCSARAGAASST